MMLYWYSVGENIMIIKLISMNVLGEDMKHKRFDEHGNIDGQDQKSACWTLAIVHISILKAVASAILQTEFRAVHAEAVSWKFVRRLAAHSNCVDNLHTAPLA